MSRIEETFGPWLEETVKLMLPHLPEPKVQAAERTDLPSPIYTLVPEEPLESLSLDDHKPDDWVWARLSRSERVTPEDWWQNVREVEFELESPL
jgi:hypothetical protein